MSNEKKDFLKFVISFWFSCQLIVSAVILALCMLFTAITQWL